MLKNAEIDVFLDDLEGLVLVDFEFKSIEDQLSFVMPDFCLAEVTEDDNIAGGLLAHLKMKTLKPLIDKYNYKNIK